MLVKDVPLATKFGELKFSLYDDETLLVYKEPLKENCLVRLHSACITSEVFNALDCDCREQLEIGLNAIKENGGVLVYMLKHEGRGLGLKAKLDGYKLSRNKNIDTFEAYKQLGLEHDNRDYSSAIKALQELNVKEIRLLTNNPLKVKVFEDAGFKVTREQVTTQVTELNKAELEAKEKQGFIIKSELEK